jgi:hypothetical protein
LLFLKAAGNKKVPYMLDAKIQGVKDACRHRGMQHSSEKKNGI